MHRARTTFAFALVGVLVLTAGPAAAVNIRVDTTYDAGFFAPGTQARHVLDTVAAFYSEILQDTLSPIQTPDDFHGQFGGLIEWEWSASFAHPSTAGMTVTLPDFSVQADEYVIFVGARDLPGSTLGLGSPASYSRGYSGYGPFTPQEEAQWMSIENQFRAAVERRGEPVGEFARWGGAFTVDTVLPNGLVWHLNHLTPPSANSVDLYSVALHEIGHVLGFGVTAAPPDPPTVWQSLLNPEQTHFVGMQAMAVYGEPVPLEPNDQHWLNGTASRLFQGAASQEAAMDPSLTIGTRKRLTLLDAAALVDLGWEINLELPLAGDYNGDGIVDAGDYVRWRNQLGAANEAGINFAGDGGGVGVSDYAYWKARYGNGLNQGTGGAAIGVPEPVVPLSMFGAMIAVLTCRSRSVRRQKLDFLPARG